jgi:hypothetical protein
MVISTIKAINYICVAKNISTYLTVIKTYYYVIISHSRSILKSDPVFFIAQTLDCHMLIAAASFKNLYAKLCFYISLLFKWLKL